MGKTNRETGKASAVAAKRKIGRPTKYTPETVRIIVEARRNGETYEVAAARAGVGQTNLFEWKQKYADFAEQLLKAEKEHEANYATDIIAKAKVSLAKLITGYTVEEHKTEYKRDAHGNPQIDRQTTISKPVAPSTTAIIFALTNLQPDIWKNRQTTDINGKVDGEVKSNVCLDKIPDDLLAKVIDSIKGGE